MESAVAVCLLFSLFSVAYSSQNGVPAIIWSNAEGRTFPEALTGHSINVQQFKDDYLPQESKHHMVLFMQDKLSMEDFTQHADVYNENTDGATFHNLKHIMETETSSHVPSLSSSASLLDSMKLMAEQVHTLDSPYNARDLPLKTRDLIVVQLPTTVGLHTKEALKQIDGILMSVHEQLKKQGATFTAVYTAKASSKPVGPMVAAYQGGRHLLQADAKAESSNASYWNVSDGCLMLYVEELQFETYKINKDTKLPEEINTYTLPSTEDFDPTSDCANGTATLVVKYANLPANKSAGIELTKFEFTMKFSSDSQYWTMHSMTITYDGKVGGTTTISGNNENIEPAYIQDIWAPNTYSYHCAYQSPLLPNNTAQEDIYVRIRTVQLQVQVNKGEYSGQFGQVNDCIGFFTLPIWSAIISMAVLLSVFFFGVCMLSMVDTQDRFDDPKGKTIQVNVSD